MQTNDDYQYPPYPRIYGSVDLSQPSMYSDPMHSRKSSMDRPSAASLRMSGNYPGSPPARFPHQGITKQTTIDSAHAPRRHSFFNGDLPDSSLDPFGFHGIEIHRSEVIPAL